MHATTKHCPSIAACYFFGRIYFSAVSFTDWVNVKYGRGAEEFGMFFSSSSFSFFFCFIRRSSVSCRTMHFKHSIEFTHNHHLLVSLSRARATIWCRQTCLRHNRKILLFCRRLFFTFLFLFLISSAAPNQRIEYLPRFYCCCCCYSFVWTSCTVLNRVLICNIYSSVVNERRSTLLKQRSKPTNLFSESLFEFRRRLHSSPVCVFVSEQIEIIDTDSGMQFKTQTVTVNFVLSAVHRVRITSFRVVFIVASAMKECERMFNATKSMQNKLVISILCVFFFVKLRKIRIESSRAEKNTVYCYFKWQHSIGHANAYFCFNICVFFKWK